MRTRIHYVVWATASLLAITSSPSFAQDSRGAVIEEITVTARKVEENIQSVPISMTAFSGEALARQSIVQLKEIQSQVPNLSLRPFGSEGNSLTFAMRGQWQNDVLPTLDPSVGLYIDGFYYPRTQGLTGAIVDMERVEVLRGPQGTLYGRNTTGGAIAFYTKDPTQTFGASLEATAGNYDLWNLTGILNMPLTETVAARLVVQHGAHDGYGANGLGQDLADERTFTARGKIKATFGDNIEAVLSSSYTEGKTHGPIIRISGLQPTPCAGTTPQFAGCSATREAALQLFGISALVPAVNPAAFNAALAVLTAESLNANGFYNTSGLFPVSASFNRYDFGLDLTVDLADWLQLRSISGYQALQTKALTDTTGSRFAILTGQRRTGQDYASQELQLLGSHESLNWVVGGYFGVEQVNEFSLSTAVPATQALARGGASIFDVNVKNKTIAGFVQANWEFATDWRLTAGFRYSSDLREMDSRNRALIGNVCRVPAPGFATVNPANPASFQCPRHFRKRFSEPSWLISLDHQFTDQVLLYAKVARGYRTGGQNFRGTTTAATFATFQPEFVTEYEAGVKSELFGDRLRLNLAAFYDDYTDIQRSVVVLDAATGGTASLVTNAAEGKVKGFEVESTFVVTDQFTLNGGVGLTSASYDEFIDLTGDRSDETFGVPKWTAYLSGRYVVPTHLGDLAVQVDYNWQSRNVLAPDAVFDDQVTQSSYGLLNGRISLDLEEADATVAVFAKNLAGKKYNVSAFGIDRALGFNSAVAGAPRTYGIQLTKRFGGV